MQEQQEEAISSLTVFYSYAHEDERLCKKLETHLSLMRKQGIIAEWHDRKIMPGSDWSQEIDVNLNSALIILLLISSDFLASEYCYGIEMQRSLERHKNGDAYVIPIILRPVDWESAPFAHLQCLPRDARAVTEWDNRDAAFRDIAIGIRTVIEQFLITSNHSQQRAPSSGIPVSGTVSTRAPAFPIDRDRQRMLKRVYTTWIAGVLEQSLHGAVLMELGLEEKTDVLDNPWRLLLQEVDKPAQVLPTGTHITKVYDETDGGLLILGEPGAGKTTLLFELARDLLERAQMSDSSPMPVVFNLSSWSKKRPVLNEWLVEELSIRYGVPHRLGQSWVSEDRLLLLLDGLDEVAVIARKECIDAINDYQQIHPHVQIVVCSRSTDYLNQSTQLRLDKAVVVQPLTQGQINAYLESVGERAAALREALSSDEDIRELATTPLMLTILVFAFKGMSLEKIDSFATIESKREQIFAYYVQHMLKRRGASRRYTSQQIMLWLTYLARQMKQQSQTVFYVEQMQPDWLPKKSQRYLYRAIAGMLLGGLLGGLIALPAIDLFGQLINNLNYEPFYIINNVQVLGVIGLLIGLAIGLLNHKSTEIRTAEVITLSWANALWAFTISMVSGSFGLLITEYLFLYKFISFPSDLFIYLLITVLAGGILSALATRFPHRKAQQPALIVPIQRIWQAIWRGILIGFISAGLDLTILSTNLGQNLFYLINSNELFRVVYTVLVACIAGLIVGLIFSVSTRQLETRNTLKPNQGIWRSAYNGARVLLGVGLIVLLITQIPIFISFGLRYFGSRYLVPYYSIEEIIGGVILGLMIGAFFGLLNGGMTCIKHVLLRLFLWWARTIPWNYAHFLDYAAERILLHKVGGGYIFPHRLLLDYFASLETMPFSQEAVPSSISR